jgi:hypothetical protein
MTSLARALLATLLSAGLSTAALAQNSSSEPTVVNKVGGAVKRGASAAERGIDKGVSAAASGVKRAASAAERGAKKAGSVIERTAARIGLPASGAASESAPR